MSNEENPVIVLGKEVIVVNGVVVDEQPIYDELVPNVVENQPKDKKTELRDYFKKEKIKLLLLC